MLEYGIILRLKKIYRSQAYDWSYLKRNFQFLFKSDHMPEVQNLTNQLLENDFMLRLKKLYKHQP